MIKKHFMKKILLARTGVTLLEGLIALGLLALVAAGTFGVLLSVSHKSTMPDLREEMALAVEQANDLLQIYADRTEDRDASIAENSGIPRGLCGGDATPFSVGEHHINCLLPAICDKDSSSFSYTVSDMPLNIQSGETWAYYAHGHNYEEGLNLNALPQSQITFTITCNGFTL